MPERINDFQSNVVIYTETTYPNDDTECDVYIFDNDPSCDLAIIKVKPHGQTPKQRVVSGEQTFEGYISGFGNLCVNDRVYTFPSESLSEVEVKAGDCMQWRAGDRELVFYEICAPPYVDGRFEEITQKPF